MSRSVTDLAGRLVQSQVVPQFLFANGTRGINLVSEDEEGNLGELFNGQKGIEFGLGF